MDAVVGQVLSPQYAIGTSLLSYVISFFGSLVALLCAHKLVRSDGSIDKGMLACAAVALGGIGWSTIRLWRVRARSVTDNDFEFEHNTPEERHRFLSHVALMLCVLSAVAVLYVLIPVLYLSSCR